MALPTSLAVAFLSLLIERLVGYPKSLANYIGHPVEWMGALVTALDTRLNGPDATRLHGALAVAVLIGITLLVTLPITLALRRMAGGMIIEALLASSLLAQTSLRAHVEDVVHGLELGLGSARRAVSRIVGRDPAQLDASGVARAAIESLAENASDGVVAPALYLALFGLPGIAVYKAVNTADSMIGHKSARYLQFGWASARLDDLLNLPASRLTALIFAAAATPDGQGMRALAAAWRDAGKHLSPNAGWPEAAMAGALGITLGGPRSYQGRLVELPTMGDGRTTLDVGDIRKALRLYGRAMSLLAALVGIAALIAAA